MLPLYITLGVLCLLYLILVFLTSPAAKKHKDLDLIKEKYIAHRGLHDEKIPENSLESFRAAVKQGFPIEIDLHLTKDGKVVVFHDGTLKRMCGEDVCITDLTLREIKKFRLAGTDEQIPTLTECLDTVKGKVPLLIEFKMEQGNTNALCKAANEILKHYKGDSLVQSFYPQVVRWYKLHRKDVCRGQLACQFKKKGFTKWLSGNLLLNFMGRPHFVSYKHSDARSPMLKFAVWQGAFPVGWTYRSKVELDADKKYFKTWIFESFDPKER